MFKSSCGIQRQLKLVFFSQKDKFFTGRSTASPAEGQSSDGFARADFFFTRPKRKSEQALCRCGVKKPGIYEFGKSIFGKLPAVNQQVIVEGWKGVFQPDGEELSPDGLVAELLAVDLGDIPDCECLSAKELPQKTGRGYFVLIEIYRRIRFPEYEFE